MKEYSPDLNGLHEIIKKLRSPEGCPWDRVQTAESLTPCISEECAELIEAIENKDEENIREELGDILMNVVFQAELAEERGSFTLTDVVRSINEKMIRRHVHVFGEASADNPEEVLKLWDKVKAGEHREDRKSLLDGIAQTMSPLSRAEKLQKKAAKVGFDWNNSTDIVKKIREELEEYETAAASGNEEAADEELGDLLFAVSNLARHRKRANSDALLRQANRKFERRFRYIEQRLTEAGKKLEEASLEEMDALWNEAKKYDK